MLLPGEEQRKYRPYQQERVDQEHACNASTSHLAQSLMVTLQEAQTMHQSARHNMANCCDLTVK